MATERSSCGDVAQISGTCCSSPHQQDSTAWLRSSSHSCSARSGQPAAGVLLPPLMKRSAEQQLEACLVDQADCSAVLRRTRKAELVSCVLGHNPGSQGFQTGLLLDLELKEQQLASKQHHRSGRIMLEGWVDDVLGSMLPPQQHLRSSSTSSGSQGAVKGAAAAGLSRQQLLAAGLSSSAVDQLYRALYVYSMGFVDTVKELLGCNGNRQELLQAIWRAFLVLAEYCMKATFKSDYMALVNAAGTAMTELLCTKQALSQVRHDNATMVKDLGSLSAAEAEASAQRRSLKAQVDDLKAALSTEQAAHHRAVQQYVDALDAKSDMQLQLQASQQALAELSAAHDALDRQHQQLQQQHGGLMGHSTAVRDIFRHVDEALGLDPQLDQQVKQWLSHNNNSSITALPASNQASEQQQQQEIEVDEEQQQHQQQPPFGPGAAAFDMQPLAERLEQQVEAMYGSWRSAVNARDTALTERFRMADQLREAEEAHCQMQQQHRAMQQTLQELQQQLGSSQAEATDLTKRLTCAHESLAQHQLDLAETEGQLQHTRSKATALESRCTQLQDNMQRMQEAANEQQAERIKLDAQLTAAVQRLGNKHRLMAEISKGFAVAMQSQMANQTARGVTDRLLKAERAKGAHMNSSLDSKDRLLHDLQARVREQANQLRALQSEAQLLEASLQEAQRQAMGLGSRLTLTEARNDELLGQTQSQQDQLAEAATRANKLVAKLEKGKQQLERAQREIKELKDAAQVSERIISEGRLLAKSLTADVQRITREKQVLQERAETTKARLELEVQRLSGELTASERKLELKSADLAAERDRVAAQAALLERKRGKKRRWKEAYHSSADEVAALHTQLLAKHKDLALLEAHLAQLHTELMLLGIGARAEQQVQQQQPPPRSPAGLSSRPASASLRVNVVSGRPTSAAAQLGATSPSSRAAGAGGADSLPAARQAHAAAAEQLTKWNEECLQLDKQAEMVDAEQQQLLLGLADPALTKQQIKSHQAVVEERRAQLQGLRQQRFAVEESRGAAAAALRQAEAVLRDAHHTRVTQRQQLLEQQAMQTSDLVNAAAMAQLAAAEEAEEEARAALGQQVAAFEAAQADRAATAQRMQDLQAGIDTFMHRISGLEGDRAALEEQLKHTHHMVTCLQAEVSAVNSDRERIRSNASQAEERIAALQAELETSKQAVTLALKAMEAKHAAERQLQEQRLGTERNKAAKAAEAADAAVCGLKARVAQLKAALMDLSACCYPHACASSAEKAPLLDRDSCSSSTSGCGQTVSSSGGGGSSISGGRGVPLLPLSSTMAGSSSSGGCSSSSGQQQQQIVLSTGQHRDSCWLVSTAGERWLYMHLPDGPWRRARQLLLLQQQQQEGLEGLMRQSGSVPSTPRNADGQMLGLPPSLPGLSLSPEGLLILIGELLLHKIDADTASDDRMLMCAAAAAAGLGTASSSAASSRAASRPATASMARSGVGGGGGGNNTSSGTLSGATSAATAASAAGALLFVEEGQAATGLRGSSAAAVAAWWSLRFRRDLEGAVYDFFLARCGCRPVVEAHCSALVAAVRKTAARSKRVSLFGRCLGLLEPVVPAAGVGVLLHFLAQLHSACGPLVTEATEGSSQVVARTAAQLAMQVLQPTAAAPCPEVAGLSAAITAAAGGSNDNAVDVDVVMELLLSAWGAQRAADRQQLERVVLQTDPGGRGLANQDEFAALVKQVAASAGPHLHHEQITWLFASAVAASGPGALAVTPAGFSTAVLDAGLVGSAAHLRRHPAIAQRPAFSDYRLLMTSWQAVKPLLKEVLRVLPKTQPALAPDVPAISTLAHKLDEALAACGPPAEAWHLYRRILGFYSLYGSFPEAVPYTPRTDASNSSTGGTPRSQLGGSAVLHSATGTQH